LTRHSPHKSHKTLFSTVYSKPMVIEDGSDAITAQILLNSRQISRNWRLII
jgi:hypothetical protein